MAILLQVHEPLTRLEIVRAIHEAPEMRGGTVRLITRPGDFEQRNESAAGINPMVGGLTYNGESNPIIYCANMREHLEQVITHPASAHESVQQTLVRTKAADNLAAIVRAAKAMDLRIDSMLSCYTGTLPIGEFGQQAYDSPCNEWLRGVAAYLRTQPKVEKVAITCTKDHPYLVWC